MYSIYIYIYISYIYLYRRNIIGYHRPLPLGIYLFARKTLVDPCLFTAVDINSPSPLEWLLTSFHPTNMFWICVQFLQKKKHPSVRFPYITSLRRWMGWYLPWPLPRRTWPTFGIPCQTLLCVVCNHTFWNQSENWFVCVSKQNGVRWNPRVLRNGYMFRSQIWG